MKQNKKRILFIDGPLGGGGAERVLIDVLRNIDYNLYDVDLAVICRGGALMDEVPEQVNVIELWDGYSLTYKLAFRMSKWLRSNWLFSRKMNGKKLRKDYDIEISFLEGMPLKLGALRKTAAKKATWVHADLFTHRYEESQFYPGEEIEAYNKMDVVVNVSKQSEDAFCRRFPDCFAEKRTIYNPIDRHKIERMSGDGTVDKDNKRLTIITVGRLTAPKNPRRFLQVAKLAKQSGLPVRFKWVGDGELRPQMESMRNEMGLQDMVEFTGFVKNPYPHIKAADIMMVTSDFEGFCLVICEAMCLGIPVISTSTAGPSEIIGDNEYGILTELTAESLFEALNRWIENPTQRQTIAEIALRRPDEYSVERTIKQVTNLI